MTIPRNVTRLDEKRLRHRARKMRQLRGLNWSQQEIADALKISRTLVRKTLGKVDAATDGSLYWGLLPIMRPCSGSDQCGNFCKTHGRQHHKTIECDGIATCPHAPGFECRCEEVSP